MIIDTPQSRDVPGLKALWQQAFGDPESFIDRFFETGFSKERCRCLYENGDLAAVLYWFDCQWQDQKLAYLYAIATDSAFQNKGFCKALMADTHQLLAKSGYAGAVLVPAGKPLFQLYGKLGYVAFCPMETFSVTAADATTQILSISPQTYAQKRRTYLPENSILQEGTTLTYLSTYAAFYEGDGVLFCCSCDGDTVYFQEFLGDASILPHVLAALNGKTGILRQPGGNSPFAMYKSFTDAASLPAYFGIPLD